jgi:hypothetical protein
LKIIPHCSAIGYTAKGAENMVGADVHVECVGIPPYPGSTFPRVTGVLTPIGEVQQGAKISFVIGDALEPRGDGPKLVAHVVNDATTNWGGRGFAQAVRRKWPAVQEDFGHWATGRTGAFSFGSCSLGAG